VRLCLDQNGVIAEWVRRQVPYVDDFGKCTALGLTGEDGAPLAGAVYHEYHPSYGTIMISFAAASPKWATPRTVGMFLRYPFAQLNVNKLRAAIAHTNTRSLKLTQGVGFKQEAILKDEFGKGIHAVMFRLMRPDFIKRYGLDPNEQRQQQAA